MAYAYADSGPLDYCLCRYGTSRLVFRGPAQRLDEPYLAVLGGTESYGKFVPRPWPTLVGDAIGMPVVNLACVNASADAYLADEGTMRVASGASMVVLQITGAANLTNPFYAVHPRRNDRFLRVLPPLSRLYPEVEFTNVHFTRHLLLTLSKVSGDRFATVAAALRRTWVERMSALVGQAGVPVILLWMASRAPGLPQADLSADPLLIDAAMIAAVRRLARDYVQIVLPPPGDPVAEGLAFAPMDRPAAEGQPGARAHAMVAQALIDVLGRRG